MCFFYKPAMKPLWDVIFSHQLAALYMCVAAYTVVVCGVSKFPPVQQRWVFLHSPEFLHVVDVPGRDKEWASIYRKPVSKGLTLRISKRRQKSYLNADSDCWNHPFCKCKKSCDFWCFKNFLDKPILGDWHITLRQIDGASVVVH